MRNDLCWRKSSYSGQGANCVEVAPTRDGVAVRDSKDPDGPVLAVAPKDWAAFLGQIKAGAARVS